MVAHDALRPVLITGSSGFVGKRLTDTLSRQAPVYAATRSPDAVTASAISVHIASLTRDTDWRGALHEVDRVVHLAGRAHLADGQRKDSLSAFREINVDATQNLAEQAAQAGVSRFVYISSVKVNGEKTEPGRPFRANDPAAPQTPYGQSKAEAEDVLRSIATQTGMEVVIIRPPLVYGPGVGGSFAAMMRWLESGIPLPLGRTANARSLVALDNLVDLIVTCLNHPNAADQTFLASDGSDLSTTQLMQKLANVLNTRARLLPITPPLMKLGATLVAQETLYQRLFGSLQVDISHTCEILGWAPPLSVDEGLQQTVHRAEIPAQH
mgnify:CR=1 FL=1